jgi:hypothetical protein
LSHPTVQRLEPERFHLECSEFALDGRTEFVHVRDLARRIERVFGQPLVANEALLVDRKTRPPRSSVTNHS